MDRTSKSLVHLAPTELAEFLNDIININISNQEQGHDSVAVSITGHAGLGKTSIVSQVAKSKGMHFIKQNLAQLQEVGDLTGFPQKEFLMQKDGTNTYVVEAMIESYKQKGWEPTDVVRMGYAAPEWLPLDGNKPVVLLLDDYTRALPSILQASMEIVEKMEYVSWKLPKGSSVILTCNPADDSDYFGVNDIGVAMKTRFIEVGIKFNKEHWALWADKSKIDSRCIDFLLYHPELVTDNKMTNPRIFEKFFRIIGQRSNWSSQTDFIATMGSASIGSTATSAFHSFIHKGLDKLPTPEELMVMPITDIPSKMAACMLDAYGKPKNDVINIVMTRLTNYLWNAYENKKFDQKGMDRLNALQAIKHNGQAIIGSDNWAFMIDKLSKNSNFFTLAIGTDLLKETQMEQV
jgi:hypothetical protein